MTDLWRLSALEIAAAFADGEASAVEIVDSHLGRIDQVNPSLNAIVRRLDDEARGRAAELDRARERGEGLGPLAGVPFTIKENIDVTGSPTTYGLPMLADAIPTQDSPIVERLRNAGAIPLARTNMPDLGLRMHTDSALHGRTLNPWDSTRTTAGSSGGEAVALATGMSPLGLGNDLGGSLRNPASCCSIASIKPTLGRVPRVNEIEPLPLTIMLQLLAVDGPMARRVRDVRAALRVISGAHPRDPWSAPMPLKNGKDSRRVAVMAEPPGGTTDPRIATLTRDAAAALAEQGVEVEEIDAPRFTEVLDCWRTLVVGNIASGLDQLQAAVSADAFRFLTEAVRSTGPYTPEGVEAAWPARFALGAAWAEFFTQWDAILTPTWTRLPFPVGFDIDPEHGPRELFDLTRPIMPANVLGLPSAAVPAGLIDGLPVGVLLTGPAWADLVCLELAEKIEASGIAPDTPIDPRP
jgi:amidase